MKKLSYLLVPSGLISASAFAEDGPHSLSANVSMTSDYVFRGITQSSSDPAIQGGFDYSHSSGFYL
ncbi:MAG: TorF family putative porin, partial [Gammaproteobacteria bacterium]|nr:TorF family putative porin [Gammaproteobacteria bacterium]